jgi:hypothetical protein
MAYGSTIRTKYGYCQHPGCKTYGPLTKKLCGIHYWSSIKLKSAAKQEEKEVANYERLTDVMDDLDAVFSQYVRLKASDENGYITCYCGAKVYWTEADNSHYMPRAHMNTRYFEENCAASCKHCNQTLKGNLPVYGAWLETRKPGSVEALEDMARVRYNYDVPELKGLIAYYSKEVRAMKAKKPMKL